MNMIGTSVNNVHSSLTYQSVLDTVQNPLIGIIFGIVLAAVMQSSSAAIGILQTGGKANFLQTCAVPESGSVEVLECVR